MAGIGMLNLEHYENQELQCTYNLNAVVNMSTVHKHYSDSGTNQLSFDFQTTNRARSVIKDIATGDRITFGDGENDDNDIFVIQSLMEKSGGVTSASVTVDQYVNVMLKRIKQPAYLYTVKNTTSQPSTVYMTAQEAFASFFNGVDNKELQLAFYGYFPRRPMQNLHFYSGDQLLNTLKSAYPGIVFRGHGKTLEVWGFQQDRDQNGNLQNVRDIFTGERFDANKDLLNVSVKTDETQVVNAVRVKAAMLNVEHNDDDSESTDENIELDSHFSQQPAFSPPSFIAVSQSSVDKYGMRLASDVLEGFTVYDAAKAAAREKMITEPVKSITGTLVNPSRAKQEPVAGREYVVSSNTWSEPVTAKLVEYDWYPFNPSKGINLTFSTVNPNLLDTIRTLIVHDIENAPELSQFKELTSDSGSSSDGSGSSGDSGDDSSDQTEDTDSSTDRPDDAGDGSEDGSNSDDSKDDQSNSNNQASVKAYLPISDKDANAHISRFGNLTLLKKNGSYDIRVTDTDHLVKLRDGTWQASDADNRKWTHLFKADYHYAGDWIGGAGGAKRYYTQSDFYLGQLGLFNSGLITTTSGYFTFRSNIQDSDYDKQGKLKHVWHKSGNVAYIDDASPEQPGDLATIQAGKLVANESKVYHYVNHSQLSLKKNVHKLTKEHALKTVLNTDIATYTFKNDQDNELEASVIIDDVHKTPQWNTPEEFVTNDGKNRKDSVVTAFLVKSVQALNDKISALNAVIDKQNKQIVALQNNLDKN